MYLQHWGLTCAPFDNTPNPAFFYASAQHQEALARLMYVVQQSKGAAVLTGVFGCGKTLVAHALMHRLALAERRYRFIYVSNPLFTPVELLHGLARQLSVPNLPDRRSDVLVDDLLLVIEAALRENARDGKTTVFILDEAHVLREDAVIDQLRLLLNFQETDRFLLNLILMGQPELRQIVERHKPLAQRVCLGYHLAPFKGTEVGDYLAFRLRVAGAQQADIFSAEAVQALFEHSGGIARRINQIADFALLSAMEQGQHTVNKAIIEDALVSIGV